MILLANSQEVTPCMASLERGNHIYYERREKLMSLDLLLDTFWLLALDLKRFVFSCKFNLFSVFIFLNLSKLEFLLR